MAEVERKRVDVPATVEPQPEIENLPTLFGRLGDDVMRLVDAKLSRLRVALKEDATKAELQLRTEEARESTSRAGAEMKDTEVNQYQQVRETISDTLDWREQFRRRPLPCAIGAARVGFLLGYSIIGAFKSDGDD